MNTQEHDNNSVRPAARTPRLGLAVFLGFIRRTLSGDRFERLYQAVRKEVSELKGKQLRLLDYGCGAMDFSLRLKQEGVIQDFLAMDVYAPPVAPTPQQADERWLRYRQITETSLKNLEESFDVVIVIDVLHHAEESQQAEILAALARVGGCVIVKDHFEYGWFSRQMLRLADWFGNFAYGVQIPTRYFDEHRWDATVRSAGLRETKRVRNVAVHEGLFAALLPARHHFIALLSASNAGVAAATSTKSEG